MEISAAKPSQFQEIIQLFTRAFSDSEGAKEGKLIGNLVAELIDTTSKNDLLGFVAMLSGEIAGCVFFSRVKLSSNINAFILSPLAVTTKQQGKGVGQRLVDHGIKQLKAKDVELVFTYGDPAFYGKTGFQPLSETVIKAPFKLTYPEGWLAQSLNDKPIEAEEGALACVNALQKPVYW